MELRALGASGLEISPIVLGTMWHRLSEDAERTRIVHAAIDLGIRAIDTAPLYGFGDSERHLGRALAGRRDEVVLCTKVGLGWEDDHGEPLFEAWIDDRLVPVRRDSRPAAIRREIEDSLGRLATDHLDLVQVHQRDAQTPCSEVMETLEALAQEGKLRAIALCNHSAADVQASADALTHHALACTQDGLSLLTREPERALRPTLDRLGIPLLAYSPLEAGLLAGEAPLSRAGTERGPLFHPQNLKRIDAAVRDTLLPIAQAHDASPARIALAWVLGRPGVAGAICGASSEAQLRENVAAASVSLRAEERRSLDERFEALRLDRAAGRSAAERARRFVRRKLAGLRRRLSGAGGGD